MAVFTDTDGLVHVVNARAFARTAIAAGHRITRVELFKEAGDHLPAFSLLVSEVQSSVAAKLQADLDLRATE